MNLKVKFVFFIFCFCFMCGLTTADAAVDYKQQPEYLALRDSLHHNFNEGDSAGFFQAVANLEEFLLNQGDLHAYYTQRCNEIVFLLNRQSVFEAYKLAMNLSKELRERKLDKELYMAINMMGHIYNYCGNKESARQCFREVLQRMKAAGYTESMPPIYMNLVQVEMDTNPEEAMRLLDEAARTSTSPDRLVDIEAYRAYYYYRQGDKQRFLEGYRKYKENEAQGYSSVHARSLEVCYLTLQRRIDEAVRLAQSSAGAMERYSEMAEVYETVGDWKRACETLHLKELAADSINSVILSNSMQGIQSELQLYETERKAGHTRTVSLMAVIAVLLMLVMALIYIVLSRRRHMRELKLAHDRALESDRLKTEFIRNISHEIRTPLNIVSGFTQVMANNELDVDSNERREIAHQMIENTRLITSLVDEMLDLSLSDASQEVTKTDRMNCNQLCRDLLAAVPDSVRQHVRLEFESDIPDEFRLRTNHDMLLKMLRALLDNAVKNTPKGSITLRLQHDAHRFTFAVEDTGTGVPAAEAEHIFERFVKLNGFKEGLGLGLTLSRSMARRLGGDVTLDTTYQGGARFVLTLPC